MIASFMYTTKYGSTGCRFNWTIVFKLARYFYLVIGAL
jgi:hypothetical protein